MIENSELPFPLAYLDWCKARGIKTLKDTENKELVDLFYYEVWEPQGKRVNGIEYGIARGMI